MRSVLAAYESRIDSEKDVHKANEAFKDAVLQEQIANDELKKLVDDKSLDQYVRYLSTLYRVRVYPAVRVDIDVVQCLSL